MEIAHLKTNGCVNQSHKQDVGVFHASLTSIVLQFDRMENELYIRLPHIFNVMMIATIGMFTIDNKPCSYSQKD